jgi:hypothetical protein
VKQDPKQQKKPYDTNSKELPDELLNTVAGGGAPAAQGGVELEETNRTGGGNVPKQASS